MEIKCNILIVDDNEDLGTGIQDTLKENGYSADIVIKGGEAISICQKNVYDIALIDIRLPDIFDVEVIRRSEGLPLQQNLCNNRY